MDAGHTPILVAATAVLGLLLGACAPTPTVPEAAVQARSELARLQADAQLAPLAPEALQEAEVAVQLAEQTEGVSDEVAAHRAYLAQRKVELARAVAETRHAEAERTALTAQVDQARLAAREHEAATARMEADSARMTAAVAQQRAAELQREVDAMHARTTDRGLVLTLGDVLFETGKADLKSGTVADLDQLAAFLAKYPGRSVTIEGHTDDVGTEDYNLGLSQRRAESVRGYLVRRGVDASRITTHGMGESVPAVANDSAGARQQNRRVEIIVGNPPAAAM